MIKEQILKLLKKKSFWALVFFALILSIGVNNNSTLFKKDPKKKPNELTRLKKDLENSFYKKEKTRPKKKVIKKQKKAVSSDSLKKRVKVIKPLAQEKLNSDAIEEKIPKKITKELTKAPEPLKIQKNVQKIQKPKGFFYVSDKIICPWEEHPLLYILLQIELIYKEEKLKPELKFKEKEIETIIQNSIYRRSKKDLTAPILRRDLLKVLNDYLQAGSLKDIIFKDFRIEIRKK